jgi:hypothetical protein
VIESYFFGNLMSNYFKLFFCFNFSLMYFFLVSRPIIFSVLTQLIKTLPRTQDKFYSTPGVIFELFNTILC